MQWFQGPSSRETVRLYGVPNPYCSRETVEPLNFMECLTLMSSSRLTFSSPRTRDYCKKMVSSRDFVFKIPEFGCWSIAFKGFISLYKRSF